MNPLLGRQASQSPEVGRTHETDSSERRTRPGRTIVVAVTCAMSRIGAAAVAIA